MLIVSQDGAKFVRNPEKITHQNNTVYVDGEVFGVYDNDEQAEEVAGNIIWKYINETWIDHICLPD